MRTRLILTTACLLAGLSATQAANVSVLKGEALVSRGEGYETLKGSANFGPGDMIVPKAESSVKVTFLNGCSVFLRPGMTFSIPDEPPCGGPSPGAGGSGTLQGADPALVQDWTAATQTTAFSATQANFTPYLLGAVAIGGAAAAALALSGGGGGSPTSP